MGLCPGTSSDPFRFLRGYCAPWDGVVPLPAGNAGQNRPGPRFPAVLCPECLLPACMISGTENFSMRFWMRAGSSEPGFPGIFPDPGTLAHPLRYLHHLCVRRMEGRKSYPEGHPGQDGPGRNGRFLAEIQAVLPEEARQFNRLGYRFREELSDASTYVFVKE